MMDRTIYINGKELRCGYTTGSCAAAAAKAAVFMLSQQEILNSVQIGTPKGWDLDLTLHHAFFSMEKACCSVQKDGGDDIDATDGIHIFAEASWTKEEGIMLEGGRGIGRVTRAGIGLPVGSAAINKVPQAMIREEVGKVLPRGKGVSIVLTIPEGEEIAKRTFNPQLGILGGLSIIGTSGIVEPMSENAFRESLAMDLQMNGTGKGRIVFVPGNYGQKYCLAKGIDAARIFKTSNFIGYMLEQAMKEKITEILMVGHIGKFAKLAAGNFHTHNRMSDGRRETMAAYAALCGVDKDRIVQIFQAVTTEAMLEFLTENERQRIGDLLAEAIQTRISHFTYNQVAAEVLLFSTEHGFLGASEQANGWMEDMCNETD